MRELIFVGLGGFFGAISRYSVGMFVTQLMKHTSIMATLAVNVVGCLLIGILYKNIKEINVHFLQHFLIIGFLGAFTTFSTFSLDAILLLKKGQVVESFIYIGLSFGLCMVATLAGLSLDIKL